MALRLLGFKLGIKNFNVKNSARFFASNVPAPSNEQPQHVVARVEINGHYIEDTGDFILTDQTPVRPLWTLNVEFFSKILFII